MLEALSRLQKPVYTCPELVQALSVTRGEQGGPNEVQARVRVGPEAGSSPGRDMLTCGTSELSGAKLNVNREARTVTDGRRKEECSLWKANYTENIFWNPRPSLFLFLGQCRTGVGLASARQE